jgi:hypothetical protein
VRALRPSLLAALVCGCIPDVVPDASPDDGQLPVQCRNHQRDGDESDIDCGGSLCPRCFAARRCDAGDDCAEGACNEQGVCETSITGVWERMTPLSLTNPAARSAHSMVFFLDPLAPTQTGLTLMFGGLDNDSWIWSWDGQVWTKLPSQDMPLPRYGAAMAYVGSADVMLYGGSATYAFADTWRFNGSAWKQLQPPANAGGRIFASAVFDEMIGAVRLLGGYDQKSEDGPKTLMAGEWRWDGDTWALSLEAPPPPRWGASLVFARTGCVLFGGTTDGSAGNDELWVSPGWKQELAASAPPPRFAAQMAFTKRRDRVVLFGGAHDGALYDDTWELDLQTRRWQRITTPKAPPSLRNAAMVFDSLRNRMVLFGGRDQTANLDAVWEYHVIGNLCTTDADCDTSSCVDGVCCERASCGTCATCNAPGAIGRCTPTPAGQLDADSCPGVCTASGECK